MVFLNAGKPYIPTNSIEKRTDLPEMKSFATNIRSLCGIYFPTVRDRSPVVK